MYQLPYNPCKSVGGMGKNTSGCRGIWKEDDMERFLDVMQDKPVIYYAFFLTYWTGVRVGELLALNIEDLDLEARTLTINKSLERVKKVDVIKPPKTPKSNRVIHVPEFVAEEMREYLDMLYGRTPQDRLFTVTKSHLEKEMKRGAKMAGLDEIRIHDLRHSHASMLIKKNVDLATVSNRLGHEKITTTLNTLLWSSFFVTLLANKNIFYHYRIKRASNGVLYPL
jgi:integrase